MVRKAIRKCAECGKIYTPTVKDSSFSYLCPECALKRKNGAVHQKKVCEKCGKTFLGFPKSKYCDKCVAIAKAEAKKRYMENDNSRVLGAKDLCERCGKEYIVKSGLQKYCPDCARQASLEKQRERKKTQREQKKRAEAIKRAKKNRLKVCAYCGKAFNNAVSGNLCSEECRRKQKNLTHLRCLHRKGKLSNEKMKKAEHEQQKEWQKNMKSLEKKQVKTRRKT